MRAFQTALTLGAVLSFSCARPPAPASDRGYWSTSCVSGDARSLIAGGDHTALVDLAAGRVVERRPGMVEAVGCDATGGIVIGYTASLAWPGKTPAERPRTLGDTVLARDASGAWISASRRISAGRWSGPPSVFVSQGAQARTLQLLPQQFGVVGAARALPFADSFAVRFGNRMQDGRLVLAAGWQPSRAGTAVENVPWAFFALDPATGAVEALTAPLRSDAALNQAWLQRVAATPDASRFVVAAHDGTRMTVAQIDRGAARPATVTALPTRGSPSAVAMAADGASVAVASETRGTDAPATVWMLDRAGKTLWTAAFRKNVAGLHFLPDGALVVAAGEAQAVRVARSGGAEVWRTE